MALGGTHRWIARVGVALVLVVAAAAASACGAPSSAGSGASAGAPAPRKLTWTVTVKDQQSKTRADGITRTIALDLTASNASGQIVGAYSGAATAKTSAAGTYRGRDVNATSSENSSKLAFTLSKPTSAPSAAEPAPVANPDFTGAGSVTFAASGDTQVSGNGATSLNGFTYDTSLPIVLTVKGSDAWLSVKVLGDTFTFKGTVSSAAQ